MNSTSPRRPIALNEVDFRRVTAESLAIDLEEFPTELSTTLASLGVDGQDCLQITIDCEEEFGLIVEDEDIYTLINEDYRHHPNGKIPPVNTEATLSDLFNVLKVATVAPVPES